MPWLVISAYVRLFRFEIDLMRGNFAALYEKVRSCPVASQSTRVGAVEPICAAVDTACIWYWKEVLCLQRSAVTACLLKEYGIAAEMVLGAQQMPFRAHAWVEVAGQVVNDKPDVPQIYAVLDRC